MRRLELAEAALLNEYGEVSERVCVCVCMCVWIGEDAVLGDGVGRCEMVSLRGLSQMEIYIIYRAMCMCISSTVDAHAESKSRREYVITPRTVSRAEPNVTLDKTASVSNVL